MKIMIVDDSAAMRTLVGKTLRPPASGAFAVRIGHAARALQPMERT